MTNEGMGPRNRILIAGMAALCAIYVAAALTVYPALFPDAAYGLLVQTSRSAGAPWNHVTEPQADNIAVDETYFHTMWSPGQHELPGLLMAWGWPLGDAVVVVNILAGLVALPGWYGFLGALGFSRQTAVIVCALIVMSRTFSFSFLTYTGGDQLAFMAFPYLAWVVLAWRQARTIVALAPVVVLAGFFFKYSMVIYLSAWIAAVVTVTWQPHARTVRAWLVTFGAAAGTVAVIWFLHHDYVSRGWTPIVYEPRWSTDAWVYLLPTTLPLLGGTGIDGVLSRVFEHPALPGVAYKEFLPLLIPIVAGIVWWTIVEWRTPRVGSARIQLAFVLLVTAVFTVMHGSGSGASVYLSRHYIIPGVLVVAMIVEGARHAATAVRVAVAVALLVPAVYGMASFGSNWWRHYQGRASHSVARVAHLSLTPAALGHLRQLDAGLPDGTLVVLPIPALAFEFQRTRVMATSATSDSLSEHERRAFLGRVPNLVVVAEAAGQTREEVAAWLRSFRSYDPGRWHGITIDGLEYWVPSDQPVDVAWIERTLTPS